MRSLGLLLLAAVAVCALSPERQFAVAADLERGFVRVVPPLATGEELGEQRDIWILETTLKPMRMIWIDVTDSKTGQKAKEQIWYVVYKAVNRPLERKVDKSDTEPVNVQDPAPTQIFSPEATLVAVDNSGTKVYADSILPEALAAIAKRERLPLKNSVDVVGPIPPETAVGDKKENAIYGVFMFRGVDPRADAYTLFLTGFSSAYQRGKDADGKPVTLRRTLAVEYERPGDELNSMETEVRIKNDPRWIYRPDPAPSK
ncbi:MAG: hypothetical protein AB7O26_07755 [Planctomycetaceae bacterium]